MKEVVVNLLQDRNMQVKTIGGSKGAGLNKC